MKTLQNFVNGKKVSATSDKVQDLINPATGQVFAKAPVSNASDVDKAMVAAASAFEVWKESTPGERQKAINKIADAIEDRSEELIGKVDALENENPKTYNLLQKISLKPGWNIHGSYVDKIKECLTNFMTSS